MLSVMEIGESTRRLVFLGYRFQEQISLQIEDGISKVELFRVIREAGAKLSQAKDDELEELLAIPNMRS
jgi:hypothetical protein